MHRRRLRQRLVQVAALGCLLTLASVLGISSATAAPDARNAGTIKIGAILPLSGTLSYYGQEYQRGMELAESDINSHGGIAGKTLSITFLDGPNASAQADDVRALNAQGIQIYAGTGSSSFDQADASVGDQLHMLGWLTGVDKATTEKHKYVIQPAPTTDWFVKPAENFIVAAAKKMNKKLRDVTIALVCSNDAYGQSNCASEKQFIDSHYKSKIVLEQDYDKTATDFSSVIQRLQAANPDIVLQTGYTDDVVTMWTQAKQLGYEPKWFIGSGGAAATNFVKALGSWADGFLTYSYAMPSPGNKASMQFAKAYQARFGEPLPSGHALMVYSAIEALADTLRMTNGNTNPDTVMAAAQKLNEPINAYPNGCGFKLIDNRNSRCFTAGMQWQNQKLVIVWPKRLAVAKLLGPLPVQ